MRGRALHARVAPLAGRELVDLGPPEHLPEVQGGQGVHLVVRGEGEEPAEPALENAVEGILGQHARERRGQPLEPRRGRIGAVVVHQQHREPRRPHGLRDGSRPGVGAREQDALGVGVGEAQAAGEGSGGEAVDPHRPHDDEEGGGHEARARLAHAQGEHRGHRGGDDPARREPGQEQPLLRGEARSERGHQHREGPRDQDEESHEERPAPAESHHVGGGHAGGEKDEERRDQQDAQVLLELDEVLHRHRALVGQHHPHDRDREQPGLGLHEVGCGEGPGHHHEEERALQGVRHPEAAQDLEGGARRCPPITRPATRVSPRCGSTARAAATGPVVGATARAS